MGIMDESTVDVSSGVKSGSADYGNTPVDPGASVNSTSDDQELSTRIKYPEISSVSSSSDSQVLGVGSILKNRFVIENEIGRGGMGVVYRAKDNLKEKFQDRNPYIAIKVLSEQCKANPDFLMALQREAGKAQKLAHPNIVTVYDFDSDGQNVFMTMEYLEGETLQNLLSRNWLVSLPVDKTLALIESMGEGLSYAHKKGIVHCDFKPGNVFLTTDDSVKILDFGIARADRNFDQSHPDTTRFDAGSLGALTPAYASCELLENVPPDQRDDVYGLACVAYELFTGRHPFNKLPANVARDGQVKPDPVKGLSKKQWKALLRGLAFDRSERTASVAEFLQGLLGHEKKRATHRGFRLYVALAGMCLLVVIAGYAIKGSISTSATPVQPTTGAEINTLVSPAVKTDLSEEQKKIVDRLLEAAEIHFLVKRITEPVGSNAYEAYKHVLEIDPGNKSALAGLQRIADHYEDLAMESQRSGDDAVTLSIINTGLMVMPAHAGLNKLKNDYQDESFLTSAASFFKQFF